MNDLQAYFGLCVLWQAEKDAVKPVSGELSYILNCNSIYVELLRLIASAIGVQQ